MQFRSLGWEDPLEEDMATHSSILAWRTPWTEEPGGLQSTGSQRVMTEATYIKCVYRHTLTVKPLAFFALSSSYLCLSLCLELAPVHPFPGSL